MLNMSVTAKKMLYLLLAIGLVFFGITFALGYSKLAFGILFGVILSSFRIYLLNYNVSKIMSMKQKQAKNYMVLNYMFRMFIVGFGFYIAAKSDKIDVLGTFVGVILMQPAAYFVQFFISDSDIPLNKENIITIEEDETVSSDFKEDLKGIKNTKSVLKEMFK